MCKVKICGIQRVEDVDFINKYLPEYAGFVFAPSRRRVETEHARYLGSKMSESIKKVGVFVNAALEEVVCITEKCGLDAVQLHGDETYEYVQNLKYHLKGLDIWKAIRVKGIESLQEFERYPTDAILVDSYEKEAYGGTGKAFTWRIVSGISQRHKMILAGGLNSKNICEACSIVKPYCVDVSSGVETDGLKDKEKIKDFICVVREVSGKKS